MARATKEVKNKTLSISLSPDLYEQIEKLSIESGVTKSSYVSVLVSESIRQKQLISSALDNLPHLIADKFKELSLEVEGSKSLS